jgi:hypothetical protein
LKQPQKKQQQRNGSPQRKRGQSRRKRRQQKHRVDWRHFKTRKLKEKLAWQPLSRRKPTLSA